jgi:hypothetical protein
LKHIRKIHPDKPLPPSAKGRNSRGHGNAEKNGEEETKEDENVLNTSGGLNKTLE